MTGWTPGPSGSLSGRRLRLWGTGTLRWPCWDPTQRRQFERFTSSRKGARGWGSEGGQKVRAGFPAPLSPGGQAPAQPAPNSPPPSRAAQRRWRSGRTPALHAPLCSGRILLTGRQAGRGQMALPWISSPSLSSAGLMLAEASSKLSTCRLGSTPGPRGAPTPPHTLSQPQFTGQDSVGT